MIQQIKLQIINKKENQLLKNEIPKKNSINEKEFLELKNFSVIKEIKTIIDNMKNTDKTQFLYKSDKNLIYLKNIKDFIDKKEEQKKIDFLQYLINLSK